MWRLSGIFMVLSLAMAVWLGYELEIFSYGPLSAARKKWIAMIRGRDREPVGVQDIEGDIQAILQKKT